MKVSGFTFIRNALKYDYPVLESIQSILPLCDEVIVAVGQSDDDTLNYIKKIQSTKIKIIETIWDDTLRSGGEVLAKETDKAFAHVAPDSDWAIYIQADEVIDEKYHAGILAAMKKYLPDEKIDGLLFNYLHFYGSYDYIGTSSQWYTHEIRIIRNNKNIYSYKDAQGFRKNNNEKLQVKEIDAFINHYGWVKEPKAMQRKQENFNKLWHSDVWVEAHIVKVDEYDYTSNVNALSKFTGKHPMVMQDRIRRKNWQFEYDISFNKMPLKDKCKQWIKKYFGIHLGYKNYIKH